MAMNKAERAQLDAALTEAAFRWPTEVEPHPMNKEEIEAVRVHVTPADQSVWKSRNVAKGWFFNLHSGEVGVAWSDGHNHGLRNWTGDNASRGMGVIYRTKREALLALRWARCRNVAELLRGIDMLIAAEDKA